MLIKLKKSSTVIAVLIAAVIIFTFSACGEKTADEAFLNDLTSGLEARWTADSESAEDYGKMAQLEYEKISKYKDMQFEDEKLGQLAQDYIAAIETQLEGAKYKESDYNKFAQMYMVDGLAQRYDALSKLVDAGYWSVPDDDNSQKSWKNLSKSNKAIQDEQHIEILDMKVTGSTGFGYSSYSPQIKLKNNTADKLDMVFIEAQCLDKNGEIVETLQTGIENLKPGQTGWTPESYMISSDLKDIDSFEVVTFGLSENTAPSTFNTYEEVAYTVPRHFDKNKIKVDIQKY